MKKTILASIFLLLCTQVTRVYADEVWRCPNGTYTNNPKNSARCRVVDVNTLCGSKNRYITPSNKQFFNKDELCGYDVEKSKKTKTSTKANTGNSSTTSSSVSCYVKSLLGISCK